MEMMNVLKRNDKKQRLDLRSNGKIVMFVVFVILAIIPFFSLIHIEKDNHFLATVFFTVFIFNVLISFINLIRGFGSEFYFLYSFLLYLGFVNKYSLHKIFKYEYLEPVGNYISNTNNEHSVLFISISGGIGLLLSQLLSCYNKKKLTEYKSVNLNRINWKNIVLISVVVAIGAWINLKSNILLFGRVPSIQLPIKGNIIYFLFLTRFSLYLFFRESKNYFTPMYIIWGGIIATIASVGVLSRATTILYFATIFIYVLRNYKDFIQKKRVLLYNFTFFLFFSFITVKISSELRGVYYNTTNKVDTKEVQANISKKNIETYLSLVFDRWIGLEGVMSVVNNDNNLDLLLDAIWEKSYKGVSFYSKISDNINHERAKNSKKLEVISTSVPGPIAFSYYSGSILFVSIFILLTSFLINVIIKKYVFIKETSELAYIYIAVFLTFDFIQFGISPLSLVKNWIFSLVLIFIYEKCRWSKFSTLTSKIMSIYK